MPNDVLDPGRAQVGAARRKVLTREPVRGVPAAVPAPAAGDPAEGLAELAGKALDNLTDKLGGAIRGGGGRDKLQEALQEALVETARAHATSLLEAAPMGKTLLVAYDVSCAFADGVGKRLEEVNKRLTAEYDGLIRSVGDDIGPDEQDAMQRIRRYQARSTRELGGIVEAGLRSVASHAVDVALAEAKSALKKFYGKAVDGLAERLVADNEVYAALNGLITAAAGEIPSQRRQVERRVLAFTVRLWVEQLADERLAERLGPVLRASGSGHTPVVALLATLIDIAARGTYAKAASGSFLDNGALDRVREEVEWEAWEAARRLAQRMVLGTGVKVADDGVTRLDGPTIHVPREVYARLDHAAADPGDDLRRFRSRRLVYDEFRLALSARLLLLARAHQRAIDRTPEDLRHDEWLRRESQLRRERARADEQARRVLTQLRAEFEDLLPPDVIDDAGRLDGGWLVLMPSGSPRRSYEGLSPTPEDER